MATKRKASPRRRSGSSPFGYVIFGIVAGLGIAAAAAYYIRANTQKQPAPVVTQQQKLIPAQRPSPEQQTPVQPPVQSMPTAQETYTPPVQTTQPPMVQQPPVVTPIAPETTTPVEQIAAQQAPKQPTPKPEQKPTVKEPPKTPPKSVVSKPDSQDQIGTLIHTMNKKTTVDNSSSNSAKPTASTQKIAPHYLQVGSFKSASEADAKRAQLLMQGFSDITITKATVNNTEFNRVRIGPFSSESALKEAQNRLKSQNINATVIR